MALTTVLHEKSSSNMRARVWIVREMSSNALIYFLIGGFLLVTALFSLIFGNSLSSFIIIYLMRASRAIVALCAGIVIVIGIQSLVQKSSPSAIHYLRARLLLPTTRQLVAKFAFGCLSLAIFMGAFLYGKTVIPYIAPFSWDPLLAQWDAVLFGGQPAFRIIWPLYQYPVAIYLIDFLYSLWVPLVFITWSGLLVSRRVPVDVRRQFWLATMSCWIIVGLVLATLLSSVGPCFAPFLFPELSPDYTPLNSHLAELNARFPLASSISKDYLWSIYHSGLDEPGGISAMPSMHNAQAMLFALAAFRLDRRLGFMMAAYALCIYIGSITLGWHYGIDGIIGAMAAAFIWFACGWIVPRLSQKALA